MAEASKTVEMSVSADQLWSVITDYEKYPQFISTVNTVKILSKEPRKVRAHYGIELLGKEINYVLDHEENGPKQMKWTLVESNIMKSNEGGWTIESIGENKIKVTYTLALEFKIYIPGMVLNGLVKSSLPQMLEQVEKRVKEVCGNG